jgi:RNA polymerase sigma-70 factor (ECF subfamily)
VTKSDSEFPDTRASLLLQLRAGVDQDGWQDFVIIYRPIIYRLARKRGLQDADAQDLAQHVLVSIAGAIERWQPRDESIRFRHWLRRVARNAISNVLTRRPRDVAAGGTSIHDFLEAQVEEDRDLSREIELEHRRELFLRAASRVRMEVLADSWQVFQLSVIEGNAIEEVATQMNKSVGAVYAARGRVMNRLRRIVDEMERRES